MLSYLPEQNTASSNTMLLLESLSVDNLCELQQKDLMVQELLQKDDYEFLEEKGIVYQQVRQKDQWIKRIVIPEELRSEVLAACHDHPTAGHLGTNKTLDRVGTRFFWPGMSIDVRQWVKTCADCASRKQAPKPSGSLQPIPVGKPFEMVGVDIVGKLPTTKKGNQYIVVFTDHLTKWPEAFAIANQDSTTIAKVFVEEVVSRHGTPTKLLSDRGKPFLSDLAKDIYSILQINKVLTTSYHL